MSVYTVYYRDLVYIQQKYGHFPYIFETSRARAGPGPTLTKIAGPDPDP
jgi:hypothetical protein